MKSLLENRRSRDRPSCNLDFYTGAKCEGGWEVKILWPPVFYVPLCKFLNQPWQGWLLFLAHKEWLFCLRHTLKSRYFQNIPHRQKHWISSRGCETSLLGTSINITLLCKIHSWCFWSSPPHPALHWSERSSSDLDRCKSNLFPLLHLVLHLPCTVGWTGEQTSSG